VDVRSDILAPGLLIASPPLGDPNFERTVVLLALHGPKGALGFVINRVAELKLGDVLSLAGYGDVAARAEGKVFVGGPVEPGSGWIVSRDPARFEGLPGVLDVGGRLRISSSRSAFDRLAKEVEGGDAESLETFVVLGYSGWGPGQLEGEIAHGAWLPVPVDDPGKIEGVVFDVAADARWQSAHELLGITPLSGMGMRTVGDA
jgi:putative transcriptional regulator